VDPAFTSELVELSRLLRAHLAWERDLGGAGLPPATPLPVTAAPELPAPAEPSFGGLPERPGAAPETADTSRGGAAPRSLALVAEQAAACTACRLHEGRTKSVFARGNPEAELMFIGEGPGYNEDQQGLPFVGPAGQLLDRMIAAMGYRPDDVYICNVVKCRPPQNRTPLPDEAAACAPFLAEQLRVVSPRAIVALGRCATENLGLMPADGRAWRGVFREYQGIPVMPTYHPAFLLRSPQFKRQVWDDLQRVMAHLGRPTPAR
jgi:DNA polymerase